MTAWPLHARGLLYGGDYNPDQWPEAVWSEDVALMREAGVNLVSVGIFSWAQLEPQEGRYELGWLDRVLDLLHEGGIAVDLATATASPPPWFSRRYPETLPVLADGTRLSPGARQAYCPSSPRYREAAAGLAEMLARRYGGHPALALWHVGNEYGCHVSRCYCDVSAAAFRRWLAARYGDLDTLNAAWGTAFWSQRYGDWEEVLPPRAAPTWQNPTQQLDFRRFSSDELLDCFRAERHVLRRITPQVPLTTNLMLARFDGVDAWRWGPEMDVVSNDHYLLAEDPENEVDLALAADLTRGVAGGRPWLLMEHSPSAVNWQPRNLAKRPGELRRNSLQHVARGADGALFFQWRQSRAGAEKFHSAMVPHAGTDTRVWREVVELGASLGRLAELQGSVVESDVALVFDWDARWGLELDSHPSLDLRYLEIVRATYRALWRAGVTCDLVPPDADLERYRLLLAPSLYLVADTAAARLERFVEAGGQLVVGPFSGIVDEHDHVRLGGYPGAFRAPLGVRVEEFRPLPAGGRIRLTSGASGRLWSEHVRSEGAEVLDTYAEGELAGLPAVTRHRFGRGCGWYASTFLDDEALAALLEEARAAAGVAPAVAGLPAGVEVVRRRGDRASYLFVLNHLEQPVSLALDGHDLLAGTALEGSLQVAAGGVAVVREAGG